MQGLGLRLSLAVVFGDRLAERRFEVLVWAGDGDLETNGVGGDVGKIDGWTWGHWKIYGPMH
jgi:hypothetical protein